VLSPEQNAAHDVWSQKRESVSLTEPQWPTTPFVTLLHGAMDCIKDERRKIIASSMESLSGSCATMNQKPVETQLPQRRSWTSLFTL
jgi:hypothetical protein